MLSNLCFCIEEELAFCSNNLGQAAQIDGHLKTKFEYGSGNDDMARWIRLTHVTHVIFHIDLFLPYCLNVLLRKIDAVSL